MFLLRSKLKQFVGVNVLALAMVSLGITVAYQCNSNISTQTMLLDYSKATHINSSGTIGSHSPVTNVCAGVVLLILVFGRKLTLKKITWHSSKAYKLFHWCAYSFTRPPNLKFALTLPQLGVLRI